MSSSSTITEAEREGRPLGRYAMPGEVLAGLFLDPLGLTARDLAERIGDDEARMQALLDGEVRMDADLALKLGRAFGTKPTYWTNLQTARDLRVRQEALGSDLERIEPYDLEAA